MKHLLLPHSDVHPHTLTCKDDVGSGVFSLPGLRMQLSKAVRTSLGVVKHW